ncbi:MAG: PHB depolymerase family esterase [Polyangiaceae bacterium]
MTSHVLRFAQLSKRVALVSVCTLGLGVVACGSDSDSSSGSGGNAGTGGAATGGNGGTAGATTGGSGGSSGSGVGGEGGVDTSPMGGDRPVTPFVPESYDPSQPTPLIVMLHGFGANGAAEELVVLKLKPLATEKNFIYIYPDGTTGADGKRFWNATDACCDFGNTGVDDVAYIAGLIDEAKQRYNVDDKRVYVIGHSNGGFMSHRFGCDRADLVAGIASLAGEMWSDESKCAPSAPVNALQMHGTSDETVSYLTVPGVPGAEDSVDTWATKNGCTGSLTPLGEPVDYEAGVSGSETDKLEYTECPTGGAVELWKMNGVGHIPNFTDEYRRALVDWLLAHPKP